MEKATQCIWVPERPISQLLLSRAGQITKIPFDGFLKSSHHIVGSKQSSNWGLFPSLLRSEVDLGEPRSLLCPSRGVWQRQGESIRSVSGVIPFFKINLFIYLFILGCVGSSFLCEGFLQLRRVGATLHRGARASHYRGLSCCGAQAPDAQAQQLWLTGLVAPRHVGSSQNRARTRVPCIGRRTLNHCTTREAL